MTTSQDSFVMKIICRCYAKSVTCRKQKRKKQLLICTKCQKEKQENEMSLDFSRRNGISSWCKECRAVSARKWKVKYPEKYKEQQAKKEKARLADPNRYYKVREQALKYRYSLSNEDYEALLKTQNYKCAICNKEAANMTYYLHVDHCHKTGKTRGLLCSPCNVYLGYIKDNKEAYKNAIKYLERHNGY